MEAVVKSSGLFSAGAALLSLSSPLAQEFRVSDFELGFRISCGNYVTSHTLTSVCKNRQLSPVLQCLLLYYSQA